MRRKFNGQIDVQSSSAQFSSDDFSGCNGFVFGFANLVDRYESEGRKKTLVDRFRTFGFKSRYVETSFMQYIGRWREWFAKTGPTLHPEEYQLFHNDFAGLDQGLIDAQLITQGANALASSINQTGRLGMLEAT